MKKILRKLYRALPWLIAIVGLAMIALGVGMLSTPGGIIFSGVVLTAGGLICALGLPEGKEEEE